MKTQRVSDVKLGLDARGQFWVQESASKPMRLDGDFRDSLEDFVLQGGPRRLHVLATTANIELIHHLCMLRRRDGRPHHVMLGPASAAASDSVLGQTTLNRAVSLGGWRAMTAVDEITYALASALMQTDEVTPSMTAMASRHPAWPALSFTPGFSSSDAVRLVAAMLDPRWHVNASNPSSNRKLASFFGLGDDESGRKNMLAAMADGVPTRARAKLAKVLLHTWSGGVADRPPQDMLGHRGYFWRLYDVTSDPANAALRVCRVFLTFVRDVWLDNLTPPREYEQVIRKLGRRQPENVKYVALKTAASYSRELFVPHLFFELTPEICAWEQHVKEWREGALKAV